MNRNILLPFIFLIFFAAGIYAQCNSTQIDINSANATELDRLYGVGTAKAQNIISYRTYNEFSSVDDLINVSGIGPVTLEDIKNQDLACVSLNETASKNDSQILSENSSVNETTSNSRSSGNIIIENQNSTTSSTVSKVQVIELNSQNVSQNTKDYSIKSNPAIYGLIAFSLVLVALFAARKFKTKRYKSEFN